MLVFDDVDWTNFVANAAVWWVMQGL